MKKQQVLKNLAKKLARKVIKQQPEVQNGLSLGKIKAYRKESW
jgi:hypothetical protein